MKNMPKPLIIVQTDGQLQDFFKALRISPTFDLEKTTLQIWLRTIGFELAIAPGISMTEGQEPADPPPPIILQGDGAPVQIDIPQELYDKISAAKIEQLIDMPSSRPKTWPSRDSQKPISKPWPNSSSAADSGTRFPRRSGQHG